MRKINYKDKGITLVALVITIIILLILAGVTLSTALGQNGLITIAKNTVDIYIEEEEQEKNAIIKLGKKLEQYNNRIKTEDSEEMIDRGDLTVGDEVNYTPETGRSSYTLSANQSGYSSNQTITQENYTWRVMSIDNKTKEVKIIGIPVASMKGIYFKGASGYNNGVYILNNICNMLYSNTELEVTARSINMDDIESRMNRNGIAARDGYKRSDSSISYGETKKYTGTLAYYPTLAKYENMLGIDSSSCKNDGISESDDGTSLEEIKIPFEKSSSGKATTNIIIKQTGYAVDQLDSYYDDINFYNMIFNTNTTYWVASRCAECPSTRADYCLRLIDKIKIYRRFMIGSNNVADIDAINCRLCPVVTIGDNIELTKDTDNKWNLNIIEK